MSRLPTPPPTANAPAAPARKLLVVRFLDAHLSLGQLDGSSHGLLLRMIQMISAMGRELHVIIQTSATSMDSLRQMERYVDCVREGLRVLRRHLDTRARDGRTAAEQLPKLEGVEERRLHSVLLIWRATLQTLHAPTGNDARLFRHLATHFQDSVYHNFLQLHRLKPDDPVWDLNERLMAIAEGLERLIGLCKAADDVVEALSFEHKVASNRLERWTGRRIKPIIEELPAAAAEEEVQQNAMPHGESKAAQVQRVPSAPESAEQPTTSQSFSAAEEEVLHRHHLRNATIADPHVAESSILQPSPQRPLRPPIGARRKGSMSRVPRVFTGSFSELEKDIRMLRIHQVKTPEGQPADTAVTRVDVRDFASASAPHSELASPAAVLQRREAMVSRDVQWETRYVNGELVRSRRPSRAQTVEASGGLQDWLEQPRPSGASPNQRRIPHRENTL